MNDTAVSPSSKKGTPPPDPADIIGHPGQPVRVISFASGGFDTAMQLGVIHALLVIQGKAPDAVVGVSAGAINAVALADILQAGDPEARVARFRQILNAYQQAPGEIIDSLLPDTFQIGAQQALEPLSLPIHDQEEREHRKAAGQSRSGLINLYNELLEFRLSFGLLTRVTRRVLGLFHAREIQSTHGRRAARALEIARTWFLVGASLFKLAPLVPSFLAPIFRPKHVLDEGRTAGAIIFRPRWAVVVPRVIFTLLSLLLLYGISVVITSVFLGLPFIVHQLLVLGLSLAGSISGFAWPDQAVRFLREHWMLVVGGLYAISIAGMAILVWGKTWRELLAFNQTTGLRLIGAVLTEVAVMMFVLACGTVVCILAIDFLILFLNGIPPANWTGSTILTMVPDAFEIWLSVLTGWVAVLTLGVTLIVGKGWLKGYRRKLLARYDIANSLFSEHPLRQFFVRLFDPKYYGNAATDDIVARAFDPESTPTRECPPSKLIGDFTRAVPSIHVGLTVADVGTGALEVVGPDVKVVNGLLAATAVVPFFPPQSVGEKLYIDGANITREPTESVLEMLRERVEPTATVAHIYAVSPLPFSQPRLGKEVVPGKDTKEYLSLMDVALRGLQLQRFRDATMERRMTELYTKAIPAGQIKYPPNPFKDEPQFIRAWIVPVEPEAPIQLNRKLFQTSNKSERRDLLAETVADGCRAALQVMMKPPASNAAPRCRGAVDAYFRRNTGTGLPHSPWSDPTGGPGLVQVCRHCALNRESTDAKNPPQKQTLKFADHWQVRGPEWPTAAQVQVADYTKEDPHFISVDDEPKDPQWVGPEDPAGAWPRDRDDQKGNKRPLISLLFSGGVFRGVYQVGVLNALSEANVIPDIVAGASVGSITAAMVCQSLRQEEGDGPPGETEEQRSQRLKPLRRASVARLAATYLTLNQLVLTDRFADFVRNLTLRAAQARFSVRQADRMFRRFDSASAARFSWETRLVTAGLERLFYISPFELFALVEAIRDQDSGEVSKLLQKHLQEWLDRMGVGDEVLGTEPLVRLIVGHAMNAVETKRPDSVPFHTYLYDRNRTFFFATVTNLTQGCLEILGPQYLVGNPDRSLLLNGLLASSAFPAVFRPRWSWEVKPVINTPDQYIDGGTMDNLPLDAVAQFLHRTSKVKDLKGETRIAREPTNAYGQATPHLLFSASLEVDPVRTTTRPGLKIFENDWPALWRRAGRLGYNRKLDIYQDTQKNLQAIYQRSKPGGAPWKPLNLEVVVVRPQWLCSTFGFHSMLGFRRNKQAASIAHGCATTFVALGRVKQNPDTRRYISDWGMSSGQLPGSDNAESVARAQREQSADETDLPKPDTRSLPEGDAMPLPDGSTDTKKGLCWLRPIPCPFSPAELKTLKLPLNMETGLTEIYHSCLDPRNHQPQ